VNERYFTIVNPAADGGRCGKLAPAAIARLREGGIELDVIATRSAGHAVSLAREAYAQGYRRFIAVGGDGTAHEIANGVFPQALEKGRIALGFLPLGTGNSFLRDFTDKGAEAAAEALFAGRARPADLIRLTHASGVTYSLNLLSIGFTADVGALVNRRLKPLGELGYLLGVLTCLVRLRRRAFPLRFDGEPDWDRGRYLFLSFSNSKFTGGKMMIAPLADPTDGLIEVVRWGPIGRAGLVRNLPRLYDGTHITHPLASRRAARHIEFDLDAPVDIMIDGEVLTLHCRSLDILPAALDVYI
jgi:YegS/Rv2252/BmrU family lipid kinase